MTERLHDVVRRWRTSLGPEGDRVPAPLVTALVLALIVWGLIDVRARGQVDPQHPGIHRTDFTVYTEAGAAFFDGRDPYTVTNPRGWGYLYPPLFAILVAPLHALDPQIQVLVWFALSLAAAWGSLVESLRIARAVFHERAAAGLFGPIPTWIGWTAIAAALLPTLNCLQRGQVGLAKLYLLLLGFRLLVESRSAVGSFLAGNVLALPIVLKITPLVIIGYVMVEQIVAAWRSPVRSQAMARAANLAAGTACGLVLGVLMIPAAFVGWQANLDHLDTWRRVMANAQNSAEGGPAGDNYSVRNQSLDNAVRRFGNWADYCFAGGPFDEGGPPDADGYRGLIMDRPLIQQVLGVVRLLEGCLMLAVAYRVGRNGGPMEHALVFGLACASTLVLGPIARGHYFMLQLPAVMYVGAWLAARRRPAMARAAAFIPTALIMAHFLLLGFAGRIGLLGIGTTVWFTWAALSVLWLTRRAASCGDKHDQRPDVDLSMPRAFAIHRRRQHEATH